MSVATVLRVFKNSSLITPQGEFKISWVFDDAKDANKARYHYHCTENGVAIYIRRTGTGLVKYACISD
jgi:hypothetical protein